MRGTIESINERKIKSGKRKGEPYHIVEIDGTGYFAWEASLIKGLTEGAYVEFESEGDEYPTIKSISVCTGTPPPQKQVSRYDDTKVWNTCLMCAKDITVAMINNGWKFDTSIHIRDVVIECAKAFYKTNENGVVKEEPDPEADIPMDFEEKTDQSPFDSFNYQLINTKWINKEALAEWWAKQQKALLKLTEDERMKLIKTYSDELGKTK